MHWLSQSLAVLPNTFLLAWGWQRRILCVLCGAATAFALPPYGLIPVLAITFPCLVWLLDGAVEPGPGKAYKRLRTGFALGWLFGFGYFLSGLWWIGAAFLVEAERFAWLMPFAVLAMPVGLALFTGLGVALAALLWTDRFHRIVLLAACLALSDWLRGHVLTGFPWNAFGYGVSGSLTLSQAASLVGIYGLSFLTLALAASPAVLADARPLRQRLRALGGAVACLALVLVYGAVRLAGVETQEAALDIRIVQPSIDQKDKWRPELRDRIFQTYLDMTEAPLGGSARVGMPRLVVWPESAVPFLLTQEPGALYRVAAALGEGSELVTGAIRAEADAAGARYFNSVYLIGGDGTVHSVYDKVRLVPFGEFVPFRSLFDRLGIAGLAGPLEGFEAGYQQRMMSSAGGAGFVPLICYEAIFPVNPPEEAGAPSFLLNVTNDAWFGRTPGPYQHFAQSRMRAIETGLPLVRAANTGISAIVDGKGEVIDSLSVFEKGVIDGRLPRQLGKTVYGRFGDAPFLVTAILIVFFTGIFRYNRCSRVD
ncbi:apolipoprotein N-acyltransferase [Labrenzia sp. 011]|uniref:apolipoprotein N-acyltransferase n=1 Tax=Labrenzia sp. 011 TaxID=2171494 RepID=UPI000D5128E3|nr:apolipoprotein N-acyltransferase [Labrenzia sp. 011]PVB61305.1 apolipoprotein N-acyltransferase [Labrenzia sp. 011]